MALMIWSRLFAGEPTQVRVARDFTYDRVEFAYKYFEGKEFGSAGTAKSIVSELAANAVLHSDSGKPDGWFVVRLVVYHPTMIHIRVMDLGGRREPIRIGNAEGAENGRGLYMVDQLSIAWGIEGDKTSRTVWADIAL